LHGDSNNNGKFLRANNGADPSFESIPASGISNLVEDTSPQLGGDLQSHGNNILMADNDQIRLGSLPDLRFYHDGSHSYLTNATGHFRLRSDSLKIEDQTNGHSMITAVADGAVELYFDNSKKFETYSGGVRLHGELLMQNNHLYLNDNAKLRIGTGQDLQIYHDGNSRIQNNNNSCDLRIQSDAIELKANSADEMMLKGVKDGAVELYHDNSKKLQTSATGIEIISDEPVIKLYDESHPVNTRKAFSKDLGNTASATCTVPSNYYGGGTVTVVGLSNGDHTISTTRQYAIQINGSGTATLSGTQWTMNGSGGSWSFGVSAATQGISVTNNGGAFGRFRITFDITAYED